MCHEENLINKVKVTIEKWFNVKTGLKIKNTNGPTLGKKVKIQNTLRKSIELDRLFFIPKWYNTSKWLKSAFGRLFLDCVFQCFQKSPTFFLFF